MKKVIVKNLQGRQTHGGDFSDEVQMQAWIAECVANKWWGRSEGWFKKADLTESEILEAIDERTVELDFGGGSEVQCLLPANFTVEVVDITEEHNLQLAVSEALAEQNHGKRILATIAAINTKKLKSKELSEADFELFMSDKDVAKIERALLNGSTSTAKKMIQAMNVAHITAAEKQMIVDLFKK